MAKGDIVVYIETISYTLAAYIVGVEICVSLKDTFKTPRMSGGVG